MDHPLTPWEKIAIIFVGGSIAGLTLLVVVCLVCPTCFFYRILNKKEIEKEKEQKYLPRKRDRSPMYNGKLQNYYDQYLTASDCEDWIHKEKSRKNSAHSSNYNRSKSMETLSSTASVKSKKGMLSNLPSKQQVLSITSSEESPIHPDKEALDAAEPANGSYRSQGYRNSLDRSASRKSTPDSTYGSVSSTSMSGRTSPSNMSVISSTLSNFSLPFNSYSSTKSKKSSNNGSTVDETPPTIVRLTFSLEKRDQDKLFLRTNLTSVSDIPRRSYCCVRNPFAIVTIFHEKTSLTARRSRIIVAERKSNIVRRNLDPKFHFSMASEIDVDDKKGYKIKVAIFDHDKHTKTSEVCSVTLPLKKIKSTLVSRHKILETEETSQQNVIEYALGVELTTKEDLGSIMFGLSYLPTAQRLSFSIIKAINLRFESVVSNLESFEPFVQIIQVNPSGKVLKKKRTSIVLDENPTKDPTFNETLNFDLPPNHVEFMSFIVSVYSKLPQNENSDSSSDLIEKCLGFISLGKNVTGEKEKAQWFSVMSAPRKVFTNSFKLE